MCERIFCKIFKPFSTCVPSYTAASVWLHSLQSLLRAINVPLVLDLTSDTLIFAGSSLEFLNITRQPLVAHLSQPASLQISLQKRILLLPNPRLGELPAASSFQTPGQDPCQLSKVALGGPAPQPTGAEALQSPSSCSHVAVCPSSRCSIQVTQKLSLVCVWAR